jgi:hypothetical protein
LQLAPAAETNNIPMQPPILVTTTTLAENESSTTTTMLTTFYTFSRLPLELRRKIWEDASPAGRAIRLYAGGVLDFRRGAHPDQGDDDIVRNERIPRCKVRTHKVPNILHASSESRKETNRIYELCFATELKGKPIWMDMETDGLCFETELAIVDFNGPETNKRSYTGNLNRGIVGLVLLRAHND